MQELTKQKGTPDMEMRNYEVDLTDAELKNFNDHCAEQNICPAQKIGELIHGFLVAEGVKHHIQESA